MLLEKRPCLPELKGDSILPSPIISSTKRSVGVFRPCLAPPCSWSCNLADDLPDDWDFTDLGECEAFAVEEELPDLSDLEEDERFDLADNGKESTEKSIFSKSWLNFATIVLGLETVGNTVSLSLGVDACLVDLVEDLFDFTDPIFMNGKLNQSCH